MKVLVIHGPSLDLLGRRDPDVYGDMTLVDLDELIENEARGLGIDVEIHQTAREGAIIELLIGAQGDVGGAIVNPGAYAHTSRAIADAILAIDYPVIEVHLSNVHAREQWRRKLVTGEAATGVVSGLGAQSYVAALGAIKKMMEG